jgi:hypothetical protein
MWQVKYKDGTAAFYGVTSRSDPPPETVTLLPDETITGLWGNSGAGFNSLYISTTRGRTLGRYGGTGGTPFPSFSGPVYGFFGTCCWSGATVNKCIAGLGVWSAYLPPPPLPPSPPQAAPPLPALFQTNIWTAPWATASSTTWDDGAHTGGCSAPPPGRSPVPLSSLSLQSTWGLNRSLGR